MKLTLLAKAIDPTGEFPMNVTVALADYKMVAPVWSAFKVTIYKPNQAPFFEDPLPLTLAI